MDGVFRGLRVLELAQDIAGEYAGQMCAARGAEVIKLEPPEGDTLRDQSSYEAHASKLFETLNRGKKSVVLDPAQSGPVIEKLLMTCDIVITSSTRGEPRFPLDYETARAINPAIIFLSIAAFGREGPWAGQIGNDLVMQGFSGAIMSERKTRDDGVTPDIIRSTPFSEFGTGMMASIAISSALLHRAHTGAGQHVQTSLLHNILYLQGGRAVENDMADQANAAARQRLRDARAAGESLRNTVSPTPVVINPFYRAYQTRDGAVFVGALTRGLRDKARLALQTDLLLRDGPDYDPTNPAHIAEASRKQSEIEARVKSGTTSEWAKRLEAAGVPTGEVVFPEDLAETPHLHANQYLIPVVHPTAGETLQVAPPVRYGRFPAYDTRPAPSLGSHTSEILSQ